MEQLQPQQEGLGKPRNMNIIIHNYSPPVGVFSSAASTLQCQIRDGKVASINTFVGI